MDTNELSEESLVWNKASHTIDGCVEILVEAIISLHNLDTFIDGVSAVFPVSRGGISDSQMSSWWSLKFGKGPVSSLVKLLAKSDAVNSLGGEGEDWTSML